jgi:hypothetical protein
MLEPLKTLYYKLYYLAIPVGASCEKENYFERKGTSGRLVARGT